MVKTRTLSMLYEENSPKSYIKKTLPFFFVPTTPKASFLSHNTTTQMCHGNENEEEDEDSAYFDCLPDAILLLIFNKLHDLKSLTKCLMVSKRFNSLVPLIDTAFISIPQLKHPGSSTATSYVNSALRLLFLNLFLKPLGCFNRIMAPTKPNTRSFDLTCCRRNGVLKFFKELKSLHLELPGDGGELGSCSGASFLQWKAGFGTNLKTCIFVGATSFRKCLKREEREASMEEETVLNDEELKLRVIWIISCLISASTRHCLLKQILADNPTIPSLETVVISDANKHGVFCLQGKEELVEMRNSMNTFKSSSSSPIERSPIPELNMKLWYSPVLELPESGYVMEGATLVFIKPAADGMIENDGGEPLVRDEKLPFNEAVREMIMKVKKCYLMTMSSF